MILTIAHFSSLYPIPLLCSRLTYSIMKTSRGHKNSPPNYSFIKTDLYSENQESEESQLSVSGSGYLMKLQQSCQPASQSSEGLTGPGGYASKLAHSHSCRLEVSVPQRILAGDLNPLPCGPPHGVVPMSSREQSKREQGGKCNAFYDLASEVTYHYLCYILLATQTNPDTMCQSITCYHSILHNVSRMIFTQLKLLNSFLFSSG